MSIGRDNFQARHLIHSIVFFILALNALALAYLVVDSNHVFATLASARIAKMLDKAESAAATPDAQSLPRPTAVLAGAPLASAAAAPLPASESALTMLPVAPIFSTGACVALSNLKSEVQIQSAKALLASSPLREKTWIVSTPVAAVYLAGIEAANVAEARKISKNLAEQGLDALGMSSRFVGIAKADTAASAIDLATASAAGIAGAKIVARQVSAATESRSIVALAQTRLESQFASSLPSRLPGSSLTPVACPEAAAGYFAAK